MKSIEYRRDIDGLRAVAVLAVIFFHAGLFGVNGGFVGVDVFFVISGYLISQRLAYGAKTPGFTLKEFYTRRIRRLFPALFVTTLVTLVAGFVIHPPDALIDLALSALSAVSSVANIWFALQSGYWDADAWSKPLLHTWSLSVEEQFYLAWPFVIYAASRLPRRSAFIAVALLAALSLAVTGYATQRAPTYAFYLTPFRAYEFAFGALCIWADDFRWPNTRGGVTARSALFIVGLAAIVLSSVYFTEELKFPGFWAAIPAGGAALVILAKNPPFLGLLLTNPLSRYVGLISYSLYLVHWPVLVFQRDGSGGLDQTTALLALLAIVVLSVIQYHVIETPFRHPMGRVRRRFSETGAFSTSALGAMTAAFFIAVLASTVLANRGFPSRYDAALQQILAQTQRDVMNARLEAARNLCGGRRREHLICGSVSDTAPNVLVVGDSHAVDAFNVMRRVWPKANFLVSSASACPFLIDLSTTHVGAEDCEETNAARLAEFERLAPNIDTIILAMRFSGERGPALRETAAALAALGPSLVVLGAGPWYDAPVRELIAEHGSLIDLDPALNEHLIVSHFIDDQVQPSVEELGGVYLACRPFLCPDDGPCRILASDGQPNIFDAHHFTLSGARDFADYIRRTYPALAARYDG